MSETVGVHGMSRAVEQRGQLLTPVVNKTRSDQVELGPVTVNVTARLVDELAATPEGEASTLRLQVGGFVVEGQFSIEKVGE